MFSIPDGSFKRFENWTVKSSAKETKWTSLEVRTHPTFLESLISKYDFGPVKLPGASRNGPQSTVEASLFVNYLKVNALIARELSGFTCTSSLTMNEKFQSIKSRPLKLTNE